MKKSLLKILIIVMIMILPIYIKAGTYSQEVNNANSYILGNDFRNDYQKYLMDGSKDILSFGYKNGKVERDTNFTYGGFISNDEYKITTKDNVSYLYDGVNYWTLTKDGTKYYVVGESETQDTNKNYRSRVTEYLRSDIKISGQGTLKDPWMFEPIYKVDLKVENGTVEYPNGQYIDRSGKLIANFTPTFGYRYITNDCGIYMENGYDKEKNVATVSRVNRDLTCNVIFGLGIYKVQLGAITFILLGNEEKEYIFKI